jgi:hypothetical protein
MTVQATAGSRSTASMQLTTSRITSALRALSASGRLSVISAIRPRVSKRRVA